MRTRLSLVVLTGLLLCVPDASAAWVEGPQQAVPGGNVATCLRSPAPGLASAMGPLGKTTVPIDMFGIGSIAAPLVPQQRLQFGPLADCPAIASAAGRTLVAGYAHRRRGSELTAHLIEAGRASPFRITSAAEFEAVAAAVSPAGDALIAWAEQLRPRGGGLRLRILAARRPAGGAFGAPEVIQPSIRQDPYARASLVAAAEGSGRFTIAWSRGIAGPGSDTAMIESTTAAPGLPVAPVQRNARILSFAFTSSLALSVASNGRSLLVYDDFEGVHMAERPQGAHRFSAPIAVNRAPTFHGEPAAAVRDDGAALVAWRTDNADQRGGVSAISRLPGGAFSKPVAIARPSGTGSSGGFIIGFSGGGARAPVDEANRRLRAAITADGRALLSWVEPRPVRDGDLVPRPRVALAPLAHLERFTVTTLGSPCRAAGGIVPATGADGVPGVAWTDNLSNAYFGGGQGELPRSGGRLHLASSELSPPSPPATAGPVKARVGARRQRLHFGAALRVSVRCDAPCDLRGVLMGRPLRKRLDRELITNADAPAALGTARLTQRGRTVLKITPQLFRHVAPRGGGRVRVAVHACDPASSSLTRRRIQVHVTRKPPPPLAIPIDVRARRVGKEIRVGWRTARRAFRVSYNVEGRRRRSVSSAFGFEAYGFDTVAGRGRRAFKVRLRPRYPRRTRFVVLTAVPLDPPRRPHKVAVPVEQ